MLKENFGDQLALMVNRVYCINIYGTRGGRARTIRAKAHVLSVCKLAGDWRCSRSFQDGGGDAFAERTPAVTLTHINWKRPFVTIVTFGQLTLYCTTTQSNTKINRRLMHCNTPSNQNETLLFCFGIDDKLRTNKPQTTTHQPQHNKKTNFS